MKRPIGKYLHSLHHGLHLGYLGTVFIESSYFYAKIAGALFLCTLFMFCHDRLTRHKPPKTNDEKEL